MSVEQLTEKIRSLPRSAQQQVEALVNALSVTPKTGSQKSKRFNFDWKGGLEKLNNEFTSVQLQHHINDLR